MLTRLEADGFKNLIDFAVDFGPYTCIAGPNGIGKSNVFDAIHFLSLLADHSILEAALQVRSGTGNTARLDDLFFRSSTVRKDEFKIAAEMLVDQRVNDDFGRPGQATSTFLRYEIKIGRRAADAGADGLTSDLELRSESLQLIRQADAGKRLRFPHSKSGFRDSVVRNRRFARTGYISTDCAGGRPPEIIVHQDGGSRGPGQRAPALTAPRTIVSTTSTIATPTILAARREMQKWRLLALEPSAMRRPDQLGRDPTFVSSNGAHLAGALNRLQRLDGDNGDAAGRISARLAELVPVTSVDVVRDDVREQLSISITEGNGQQFSASAVSDGTLRFLALAILTEDPRVGGVLCVEEPENGIHPERLRSMYRLMRDFAVDTDSPVGDGNVMRQLIVATHSPYLLQLQEPADILIAKETTVRYGEATVPCFRCYPLARTWRAGKGDRPALGISMLYDYLQPPDGAKLRVPLELSSTS